MEQLPKTPVSIWLKQSTPTVYYCMRCRSNLGVKLEGHPSSIIFGIDASIIEDNYRPLTFPIKIKCQGKHPEHGRCMMEYIIQGFII